MKTVCFLNSMNLVAEKPIGDVKKVRISLDQVIGKVL